MDGKQRKQIALKIGGLLLLFYVFTLGCQKHQAPPQREASKTMNSEHARQQDPSLQTIYFGGGCFWCIEAVFEEVQGVQQAVSGYTGGPIANPTYQDVCSGRSGHIEVVAVCYQPQRVSLEQLLEIFFSVHNPTTLNRQGNDIGPQYASAIFYTKPEQKAVIDTFINSGATGYPTEALTTKIEPIETFYPAEEYHQDYFAKNPEQGYCQLIIKPKVQKAQKQFPNQVK